MAKIRIANFYVAKDHYTAVVVVDPVMFLGITWKKRRTVPVRTYDGEWAVAQTSEALTDKFGSHIGCKLLNRLDNMKTLAKEQMKQGISNDDVMIGYYEN